MLADAPELHVSVLFNEPKLLKFLVNTHIPAIHRRFSALQRAEIAEMQRRRSHRHHRDSFSALQRAEIAEMGTKSHRPVAL